MNFSKKNKAIIIAFNKGYRIVDGRAYNPSGEELRIYLDDYGYFRMGMMIDCRVTSFRIHRLVAYQKFGDMIFEKGIHVRHLDGNSKNNLADNIVLGTASDNSLDRPKSERIRLAKYASSFLIKYDWDSIREDRANGMTYKEIMKKYKISSLGTISYRLGRPRRCRRTGNPLG